MPHDYRELTPHAGLRELVECFWTIEAEPTEGSPACDLILPDGCIGIIFDLGTSASRGSKAEPRAVGTLTRAFPATSTGPVSLLGVRFRPGGATPFLRADAHELTDEAIALEDLWGAQVKRVWEQLALAPEPQRRIDVLNHVLSDRLSQATHLPDPAILHASRIVESTGGQVRVSALAEAAGISKRKLERRYKQVVGVGPKLSCTIARFRETIRLLHSDPTTSLARIAFRAGYSDQSHMNRDFNRLAGLSPGAYRRAAGLDHSSPGR